MSDKKYYCVDCAYGSNDRSNFSKHEKSESHLENVVKHKANKKIPKKADYTINNVIPLNLKMGKFYMDDPNGLNLNLGSMAICQEFLRIFIKKHKLDQGYLPPFIKVISVQQSTNQYDEFIKKDSYYLPQIINDQIEFIVFEGDLIAKLLGLLESCWIGCIQKQISHSMKAFETEENERDQILEADRKVVSQGFEMLSKKRFPDKFEALMKKSFNI